MVDSGHSSAQLNNPFMMTRDMFLLKAGPAGRLEAFRSGDPGLRAQILDNIGDPELTLNQIQSAFAGDPVAIDVEWFASAADLVSLFQFMRETADPEAFAILAINPSMTENTRANWDYVGFKGGSEPGVLNLTWLLTDSEGRDHALVLSWNNADAPVETGALELIAQRILSLAR